MGILSISRFQLELFPPNQAFNMTGGEKVWLCVHDLTEDIKALHKASKEDDQRDDDDDGIPDVKQVLYMKTAHWIAY